MATYVIAPAAKPNPNGNNCEKRSTKRKAGIAVKGCGRLVNTAHNPI